MCVCAVCGVRACMPHILNSILIKTTLIQALHFWTEKQHIFIHRTQTTYTTLTK